MTLNTIITWIIVGGIAGLLAEWLIGGIYTGCIGTVLIGIVGAFVGGWLFAFLRNAMMFFSLAWLERKAQRGLMRRIFDFL